MFLKILFRIDLQVGNVCLDERDDAAKVVSMFVNKKDKSKWSKMLEAVARNQMQSDDPFSSFLLPEAEAHEASSEPNNEPFEANEPEPMDPIDPSAAAIDFGMDLMGDDLPPSIPPVQKELLKKAFTKELENKFLLGVDFNLAKSMSAYVYIVLS